MGLTVSYVMTCYNRPPEVLRAVLRAVLEQERPAGVSQQIVVVDDGSTVDYRPVLAALPTGQPIEWHRHATLEDRPRAFNWNGINNAAYAFNRALEHAAGERIVLLSSDTVIPPDYTVRSLQFQQPYHAKTIESDTAKVYCGRLRPFPAGWALSANASSIKAIGGYDERFMAGLWCEDGDFAGRLLRHERAIVIDELCVAVHQAHPCLPQSDPRVRAAIDRNYEQIRAKWGGGVPFCDSTTLCYRTEPDAETALTWLRM